MPEPSENPRSVERAAITKLGENRVYANKFAAIYDDPVEFADGSRGSYLRIVESEGRPGVAVLAVCGDQVALVKAYRYPISSWEWAVPRGFAKGDDPDQTAREELAEELGCEPDDLRQLGTVTPNSGILASQVKVYLARYSETIAMPADQNEIARVRWIAATTLCHEIAAGTIRDAFTLSAISLAQCHGLIKPIR